MPQLGPARRYRVLFQSKNRTLAPRPLDMGDKIDIIGFSLRIVFDKKRPPRLSSPNPRYPSARFGVVLNLKSFSLQPWLQTPYRNAGS
jgi:hypothetical protein